MLRADMSVKVTSGNHGVGSRGTGGVVSTVAPGSALRCRVGGGRRQEEAAANGVSPCTLIVLLLPAMLSEATGE